MHLALADVIASCERRGSADQAVRNPERTDLVALLARYPSIRRVATNGALARRLWLAGPVPPGVTVVHFPSTSPANAAWSAARLAGCYLPWLRGLRAAEGG